MTTLECATAGCATCREQVQRAHSVTPAPDEPIRLHEPATCHRVTTRVEATCRACGCCFAPPDDDTPSYVCDTCLATPVDGAAIDAVRMKR